MFVDAHCHLDDDKLKPDENRVVEDFLAANVGIAITSGTNPFTSAAAKAQAEKFGSVYFTAGIHPTDVKDAKLSDLEVIADLARHNKCVAIGETGLDYFWDKSYKDKQREFFVKQIELAYMLGLPLVVHVRDAMGDALEILKSNKGKLRCGGVMHCYSGSAETAKELIKLGFYLSFGGNMTFKNSHTARVAATVPLCRLLTETDSPYLAPEPLRGSVNTPKNIPIILRKLAEACKKTEAETEKAVYENTLALFKKIRC